MKKALSLIFMFFIFIFSGIVMATLMYSFYLGTLNFVAGQSTPSYNFETITNAFFYIIPLIIILVPSVLSYYRIRHVGKLPQIITYIIICFFCWSLLLPISLKLQKFYFSKHNIEHQANNLTGNYFRQSGDKVFYFTKDFVQDPITQSGPTTVIINTTENGTMDVKTQTAFKNFVLYHEAYPYNDILIKQNFEKDELKFFINYQTILKNAYTSLSKGFTFYLGFLSFAFALTALFALTKISNWKLLNSVFLIFFTLIIFINNTQYFNPIFDSVKNYINSNGLFIFLEKYIDNPLLCLINIIFGFGILLYGFVDKLVKKHTGR